MGPCGRCRYGQPDRPGGGSPSPGTVWCSRRGMQMAHGRQQSCFKALAAASQAQCHKCKWAKHVRPHGGVPEPGSVWCDRRHFEINKLRKMECFEPK